MSKRVAGFPALAKIAEFFASTKSSDSSPPVLEQIVEEDSEPEEHPRAALVAELPLEYREYVPIQTPIAPPEQEGLARPLGAGEFGSDFPPF